MNVIDYLTFGKGDLQERVDNILKAYGVKPLNEMARIDIDYNTPSGFYGKDRFKVYVYGDEGANKIPHMHIISKTEKIEMKVYLSNLEIMQLKIKGRIIKNPSWEGFREVRKNLIEMLKQPYVDKTEGFSFSSRYDYACFEWNNSDKNTKKITRSEKLNIHTIE